MTFKAWVASRGGPNKVAPLLGVSGHAIRVWLRGHGAPSAEVCLRIHKMVRGKVTLEQLLTESIRAKHELARNQA